MKARLILVFVALLFILTSCGKGTGNKDFVAGNDVADVIERLSQSDGGRTSTSFDMNAVVPTSSAVGKTVKVDIDLTQMSSSMVYSMVCDMISNPDTYRGKTVKVSGPLSTFLDTDTGKRYFACIIRDATACCAQGMEFTLKDNLKYPDDYPQLGTDITVAGVFDTYTEGDYVYCTLGNSELIEAKR